MFTLYLTSSFYYLFKAAIDCCLVWALHIKSTSPGKRALYLPRHRRTENAAGNINKQRCAHQASGPQSRPNCARWGDEGWERTEYEPQRDKVHIKAVVSVSPDSCIFTFIDKC